MTSIKGAEQRDGTWRWWIEDYRDGKEIRIPAGNSREQAESNFWKYLIRRNLEKEGYDDQYVRDGGNESNE